MSEESVILSAVLDALALVQFHCPLCGSRALGEQVCRPECLLNGRWAKARQDARWWRHPVDEDQE